jgi:hypothetical protein
MASPNTNQQQPFGGFYQPSPSQVDIRSSQTYLHSYSNPVPRPVSTGSYVQPHYGTTASVPPIAELPAPLPPAPPTSTPQPQLTEDELLAHKLQKLEVDEMRRRSSSNTLNHRPSQVSLAAPPSPHLAQGHLQQPPMRPHSHSVTSLQPWGPEFYGTGSNSYAPSDLPEVVVGPRPASLDAAPGAQSVRAPVTHQTASLPPPPTDLISLSTYLEKHRLVPYPSQWVLRPAHSAFFASFVPSQKSDWLDVPLVREWRTVRLSENARNPTPPSFSFTFKTKGGNFRDPQFTWSMVPSLSKGKQKKAQPPCWTYQLKMNAATGLRKSELLYSPQRKEILTTYIRAQNYDSLRFVGPDGRLYLWVAHTRLSSIHGARFDTLRHALFASTHGRHDPLYGEIVADHAYWDGFVDHAEVHTGISCSGCGASPINGLRWKCKSCVDHDICEPCRLIKKSFLPTCTFTLVNLPDEALTIRSPTVDPELVVTTLQIMKDWELRTIREQKRANPTGYNTTEAAARRSDLGRISHWRSSDFAQKGAPADAEVHGTVVKMRELSRTAAGVADALGAIGDTISAVSALGGHGGGTGTGGDGGGGGTAT